LSPGNPSFADQTGKVDSLSLPKKATPFFEHIGAYTPYLGLGVEFRTPCPSKIVYLIPELNSISSKPS